MSIQFRGGRGGSWRGTGRTHQHQMQNSHMVGEHKSREVVHIDTESEREENAGRTLSVHWTFLFWFFSGYLNDFVRVIFIC